VNKVLEVSAKLWIIDEAKSLENAREILEKQQGAEEMRGLLKPHPAVLHLMADNRYHEIDVKNVKSVSDQSDEADPDEKFFKIEMEGETDLFKGEDTSTLWLAAENVLEKNLWVGELKKAIARVEAGWEPEPELEPKTKEIHGHSHEGDDHSSHHHDSGRPFMKGDPVRFAIGTKVFCNTGVWSAGEVVAQNYREDNWTEDKIVPYQVKLSEGGLIFAPIDNDEVIRLDDGTPLPAIEKHQEVDEADKTPVTVITGFLGAGKTTLVNYILTSKEHGMRIAIIENEFGAINIDQELVEENVKTEENLITMQNGCICCTVRGDLINALQQLAERRHEIDAVIIETTGLADPGPVCVTFKMPQLQNHFRVDGIVCLVDAKFIESHLAEKREKGAVNESAQQLGFADKILLNKIDLVARKDITRIKNTIRSVNSFAEVIETSQSKVPLDRILGIDAFDVERAVDIKIEEVVPEKEACETDKKCCTKKGCKKKQRQEEEAKKLKAQGLTTKRHDLTGVGSLGITHEGVMSDKKFGDWLMGLLREESFSENLYRCKGVLCLDDDVAVKWVFQGVHDNILCKPSKIRWQEGEKRINKLVFIGRGLDHDTLEKGFKDCAV